MYELNINKFLIMKQFFYSNEKNYYKIKIILIFIFNTNQISILIFFFLSISCLTIISYVCFF